MSVFGTIKDAIFGHPATQPAAPVQVSAASTSAGMQPTTTPTPQSAPTPAPASHQTIDVDATLTRIAEREGKTDLQWQTSIVDLMKLTGMDSSLSNREELATELGYTGEKNGSAEMNQWLHTAVMNKLRNG